MSQSEKQSYYFQKGGGMQMPYRFYNPQATPFKPCECKNCPVGGCKLNQEGGGNLPYRYFNPQATPFKPCGGSTGGCGCSGGCGCGQRGGGCAGGCGKDIGGIYYNEFRRHEGMHAYNSDNMTNGAAPYNQMGGNPTHAPLHVFTEGEPLTYNYSLKENFSGTPTFDRVGKNFFW